MRNSDPLALSSNEEAVASDEPGMREFLAFELADERYALPLSTVREIMRLPPVTEVPRAPDDVLGIISVRGKITTLVDLRSRVRMAQSPVSSRTRVLLVDEGEEVMGLLVDRVLQVYRLTEGEVEMASVLGDRSSSYVMGIGRPHSRRLKDVEFVDEAIPEGEQGKELLILLDPIALLKRPA